MSILSLYRPADHGRSSVRPSGRLRARLTSLRVRWTTADGLSQLSDRELHDIGLRRDQIPDRATRAAWDALRLV